MRQSDASVNKKNVWYAAVRPAKNNGGSDLGPDPVAALAASQ